MLHKTILSILVTGVALWLPYPGIGDPVVGEAFQGRGQIPS
jgi:hypothetical protein